MTEAGGKGTEDLTYVVIGIIVIAAVCGTVYVFKEISSWASHKLNFASKVLIKFYIMIN